MAKKNSGKDNPGINVGKISDISGNVNIVGGNITMHQITTGLGTSDINRLFDQLYIAIEASGKNSPAYIVAFNPDGKYMI